jgi:hypothetical protein
MRSIALDVHRDFCEVAIKDQSGLRLAGRVKTKPEDLELFAQSLAPDDQVALEASEPALQIARIPRTPRRPCSDRQHAHAAGDRRVQGQDRQARREHAVRALGSGVPPRGLVAG